MLSRIIRIFTSLLVMIASLLGIGGKKEVSKDLISYNENRTEVVITLPENPSTGYSWEFEVDDYTKAVVINDAYVGASSTGLVGVGGSRIVTFKGITPGSTDVTFNYCRSWEGESERTVVINITVNEDGTLEAILVSDTAL